MHNNKTKYNQSRLIGTQNILHDLFNINNINLTQYSDAPMTYLSTSIIYSRHTKQPESWFCKPNLNRSLTMQNKPDTTFLVDTNFVRSHQKTYECLTLPWHNWAGGGSLTTVT